MINDYSKWCYWSISSTENNVLLKNSIKVARQIGIKTDFHVWSDEMFEIENVTTHLSHPNFKPNIFNHIKNELTKLDYDWFVFTSPTNYFVRNPGNVPEYLCKRDPLHICLDGICNPDSKDWNGVSAEKYIKIMRENGIKTQNICTISDGIWVINKNIINQFCNLAMSFYNKCVKNGITENLESMAMSYVGHMLIAYPATHTLNFIKNIWVNDVQGVWKTEFPKNNVNWKYTTQFSGDKEIEINPSIVQLKEHNYMNILSPTLKSIVSLPQITPQKISSCQIQSNQEKNSCKCSIGRPNKKICYWSATSGEHSKMLKTLVKSARVAGVQEDFHVWSDIDIPGAITHECSQYVQSFSKFGCWFKLDLLLKEVSKLDYEYFCWLDADQFFVRKPRCILENVGNGLCMIPMENELTDIKNKRGDWWGVPLDKTIRIFREFGCKGRRLYNTNGGLFIVKKDFIKTFYNMCYDFHDIIQKMGWNVPEEYCLAIMGNLLNENIDACTSPELEDIWACEWVGKITDKVPDGKPWEWQNYLTAETKMVNPAIVHTMRGKKGLINKVWESL